MPSKPQYLVTYALRVIQLCAAGFGIHCLVHAVTNIPTGRSFPYALGFVLSALVLGASTIAQNYLRRKYPSITERALESADQRFNTPLSPRTQTIFKVILYGILLLIVTYMTVCLFWNPPWLP